MAFAPVSIHQIAAATTEVWPSVAAALQAPWRGVADSKWHEASQQKSSAPRQKQAETQCIHAHAPDFMTAVPASALRPSMPSPMALQTGFSTSSILSAMPRGSLRHASPLTRTYSSFSPTARSFSTTSKFGPFTLRAPARTSFVGFSQQRTLFGLTGGSSNSGNRNMLAYMEQTANNNPGSATAQNAFYQSLLRANMPEILAERYQSGRYATNAATDQAYQKALERIGAAEVGAAGNSNGMSQEQRQAIAQAVSAKTRGGNIGISQNGSGAKNQPLYVVVDESLGSIIFKWVKFVSIFGAVVWVILAVFSVVIDWTGQLKKVGGVAGNAEVKAEMQTTKFKDVHGCEEAKEELEELVDFLKNPERFTTLGGKPPKGILLVGPPGTGKTLLARAVAGEAGVPFFYMSGSEFDEVFVGVGAMRTRQLFNAARTKGPAIIFLDELDAMGGKRNERDGAHAKQTLNQLLTEMDGFDQSATGVIVIAATNLPQSLDKALTRPGRFDRNVVVPLPDVRGRIAILRHYLKSVRADPSVDAAEIARGCPGFSGAELESIVNQAAVRASKNKQSKVTIEDLVWAKDKIMMGAERRSAVIQEKDKLSTAYHEGGHALVCMLTEGADPLYKATIMPRGHALGLTYMLPEMDKVSLTKKEMKARIDVAMGGKMAEELIYGSDDVTTGASSDISNATQVAYQMVTQAGMSDILGNVDLAHDYELLSSQTKETIEREVRRLVEEGKERAMKLLTANREGLERLARALVEYETLSKEEMEKVVRGEKLVDKLKMDVHTPIKKPEGPSSGGASLLPPGLGLPPTSAVKEEAVESRK